MIVGVLNQKGGVGKTTVAVDLAACFARSQRRRVLLVDADPQGSALAWSATREAEPPFAIVGLAKPTLHRDLPRLARDYDIVVIDGAPRVNDLGRSAILASDYVLIPVQPSPYDVWAAADTVALIREAQVMKEALRPLCRQPAHRPNRHRARRRGGAVAIRRRAGARGGAHQRVIYAESVARGLGGRRGRAVERGRARDRGARGRGAGRNEEEGRVSRKTVPFSAPARTRSSRRRAHQGRRHRRPLGRIGKRPRQRDVGRPPAQGRPAS